MRLALIASTFTLAAVAAVAFAPERGVAQGQQLPSPPSGFRPPPAAPVRPYKPVAATPPVPNNDPSFAAFRKTLGDIAQRKDRAALAKLVVTQGFFWMQDKDLANKSKPGIDNLAKAIGLDAKGSPGWDVLAGFAADPTGEEPPDHKGVICAPADPNFNQQEFEALAKSTQTEPTDWAYPTKAGVEVHAAANQNAPVTEKLGLNLVRVLPESTPPSNSNAPPQFLRVAPPSGKAGFVSANDLEPIGGDQMCYSKDASGGWKIAGYYGGYGP